MSSWHVLLKTRAGHISIIRDLTEDEAAEIIKKFPARVDHVSDSDDEMDGPSWPAPSLPSDIMQAEIIGPGPVRR